MLKPIFSFAKNHQKTSFIALLGTLSLGTSLNADACLIFQPPNDNGSRATSKGQLQYVAYGNDCQYLGKSEVFNNTDKQDAKKALSQAQAHCSDDAQIIKAHEFQDRCVSHQKGGGGGTGNRRGSGMGPK